MQRRYGAAFAGFRRASTGGSLQVLPYRVQKLRGSLHRPPERRPVRHAV